MAFNTPKHIVDLQLSSSLVTNEFHNLNEQHQHGTHNCDYDTVMAPNFSKEMNRSDVRKTLNIPIITGPNGGDRCEDADSERSALTNKSSNRLRNRSTEWEILEGLKDGQKCEEKPNKYEGYMLKRRKWPLKGWHKRYFTLDNGILSYAKTPLDMSKGKLHGTVDVGLSVISTKRSSKRIDIDDEEFIYHIKVKNKINFTQWLSQLRHHRLYRQHQMTFGSKINPDRPIVSFVTPQAEVDSKVAAWILDSNITDTHNDGQNKELNNLQIKLIKLSSLLQEVEMQLGEGPNRIPDVETGNNKKYRRRFLLGRHKKHDTTKGNKNKKIGDEQIDGNCLSVGKGHNLRLNQKLSSSHPLLPLESPHQPQSLPSEYMIQSYTDVENDVYIENSGHNRQLSSSTNSAKAVEEFVNLANEIHKGFRGLLRTVQSEGLSKKQPQYNRQFSENSSANLIFSLRQSLQSAIQQNGDLKSRLMKIQEVSDMTAFSPLMSPVSTSKMRKSSATDDESTIIHRPLNQSISHESTSVLSVSEYFDAEDNLSACTTSSEDDDEESVTDVSDDGTEYGNIMKRSIDSASMINHTGRRSKLPAPQPDTGDLSLWSLLRKNIGKDLSKISMPVTLNEPLNVLQRLCEELEYSELLDKSAMINDNCKRMVYVAAFAVSACSSSYYRAGHKPFNPLWGETFECIREDKGFRFIAEQVSHHPPVAVCRAESDNYIFWQDMRVKSKFWGKSMEIIPFASVNVFLKHSNSHYTWNKVTTCVHNILKGQRWIEQYGEMTITDGELTCKLTFEKSSYWSNKRHVVTGVIVNSKGDIIERLFGKWNEGLHCGMSSTAKCVWRPGTMPEDYELYYGFSRFTIELNELTPELEKLLPPTDTRFRPDQRLLEEGNIQAAENVKQQLEQHQRDRKRTRDENGQKSHVPLWFRKELSENGEEKWIYNDNYWQMRDNGFADVQFENLWQ